MIDRRAMVFSVVMSLVLASFHESAAARVRLAPADEYFGRQKMSVLEIHNRLHDLTWREEGRRPPLHAILHDAEMTENAVHDWEHKYPGDPWLAGDVAQLVRIYARIPDNRTAEERSRNCLYWLEVRYRAQHRLIAAARTEVRRAYPPQVRRKRK